MTRTYTFGELVKLVGVSTAVVNAWLKKRAIVADIDDRGGRGNHRRLSFRNVFEGRLAGEMSRWGLGTKVIAFVLAELRRQADEPRYAWWRTYRNRLTRPPNQHVLLKLTTTEAADKDPVSAVLIPFDVTQRNFQPHLHPGYYSGIEIDVTNILQDLEARTGDTWTDV